MRSVTESKRQPRDVEPEPHPTLSLRRRPRQQRSNQLVLDILQAAQEVLLAEGIEHFSCARVAERAGASIGSLYQYFPTKEAILFRLQLEEWEATSTMLLDLLSSNAPLVERVENAVRAFVRTECAEAPLRTALERAAPLFENLPEAISYRNTAQRRLLTVWRSALPNVQSRRRLVAFDLVATVLEAAGRRISGGEISDVKVDDYADEMAKLVRSYLLALD